MYARFSLSLFKNIVEYSLFFVSFLFFCEHVFAQSVPPKIIDELDTSRIRNQNIQYIQRPPIKSTQPVAMELMAIFPGVYAETRIFKYHDPSNDVTCYLHAPLDVRKENICDAQGAECKTIISGGISGSLSCVRGF